VAGPSGSATTGARSGGTRSRRTDDQPPGAAPPAPCTERPPRAESDAGAAGALTAQVGDALRVWLLSRRAPDAGYALLAGTLVALSFAPAALGRGRGPRRDVRHPAHCAVGTGRVAADGAC
jgi:hypothetical protein